MHPHQEGIHVIMYTMPGRKPCSHFLLIEPPPTQTSDFRSSTTGTKIHDKSYPKMKPKPRLTKSFIKQIRYLLKKSHVPRVYVGTSRITGAGNGVFWKGKAIHGNDAGRPLLLCLYPGIYTPGIHHNLVSQEMSSIIYLAKELPPSGIPFPENAFIINLLETGGYLDGCALTAPSHRGRRRLDENPSACGHIINHDADKANVEVVSFVWRDILNGLNFSVDGHSSLSTHFELPNALRFDGSSWYLDESEGKIKYFPTHTTDGNNPSSVLLEERFLCGAAVVLRPTCTLNHDDELLMNYCLKRPYPNWALSWYQ